MVSSTGQRPHYSGWNRRPPVVETVSADQRIWFISDLHIGDATPCDAFFGKDRHLMALVDRVEREGALLVIVGDAIDFNQAWSMSRVLAAHQDLFAALSRLAKEGRLIYVIGNHDYEINLFQKILSFRVCDELHVGDRVLVLHGWQFDPFMQDTVGRGHEWSTTVHHLAERYLNTWLRIPLGEFYTLGNRLMFWAIHKIALIANLYASTMKRIGLPRSAERLNGYLSYWAQGNMGDSMGMFRPAAKALREGSWPALVCGHSHLPGIVEQDGLTYVNTGSWTFASSHYVIWDRGDWTCADWITGRQIGREFYEPLLDGHLYDKDFWQWWRENYMGLLRFREGEERKGRLRGWESYVRDFQHLSQLHSMSITPLPGPETDHD
ncbi:MAG: UDP-2,3-diacylglucosamine pyrophosphatase LpxH [Myxococcota bacterium]|jgi:UDP-2,3-diacylglucosamine pyrophosphatase LpxH